MSFVKLQKQTDAGSVPPSWFKSLRRDIVRNWEVYVILLPIVIYYIIFNYFPMGGALIAFQDWRPGRSWFGPDARWVGFRHFNSFFESYYFTRTLFNTLTISLSTLIWGFPAPILLAILLNELRGKLFPRIVQTIIYLPHFISMVVLCGIIRTFVAETGVITNILSHFGFPKANMLLNARLFVPIYVISNIWQGVGWGSIVYLAALTSIDQELYEAAEIDGAGRWKQTLHITLPGIVPTIIILFIMRMGSVLSVGSEKILLLYNEGIYETADVISTFTYRKGLLETNWSYASAVGLFNSVVNFVMVITVNKIARQVSEISLW
jgi:putative aldouronate transport system permease protein